MPGTVAGALLAAGRSAENIDGRDWWYRTRVELPAAEPGEELSLRLGGVATVCDVYLDGEVIAHGESMYEGREIGLPRGGGSLELAICCRALAPRLAERRRPRARWRTRLVDSGNLRFFRTMLLGRAPGFAPGPPVVGPWRPVELVRRRGAAAEDVRLRARCESVDGILSVSARVRSLRGEAGPVRLVCRGAQGEWRTTLELDAGGRIAGELRVPDAERWWPHTHGVPSLYDVALELEASGQTVVHGLGRVGFRELRAGTELQARGLDVHVNGVSVFARGAVWTPVSLADPHAGSDVLRPLLAQVVDAGMNLLRIPGIATYESDAFLDLCDELGIMVWQDFMLANLDYPQTDPEFMRAVEREASAELARLGHRPCLVAVCGGSEVAQQVAMLGLDPTLADGPLYEVLLPEAVEHAEIDAPYVPSTPWGGELPFRPDRGVAHYYGVGAYLRSMEDVRRSQVKFAAECLAFANVPDDVALERIGSHGGSVVHHPAYKAAVPRDAGAGWDFEDVRDHYLRTRLEVDPLRLRQSDHDRYLELSRVISGEVMAEVFGEWRRPASGCSGALVLWLKDLRPGSGWGVLDDRGEPKVAYHFLRRALAPAAVWSTDEGLGGVHVHVANDGPAALTATLRVTLYRNSETPVETASRDLGIPAHAAATFEVEALLGRFVDAAWAYGFGPPGHDLIVLTLEGGEGAEPRLISQSFRMPTGRPMNRETAQGLGLTAKLECHGEDRELIVTARRLVYCVRVQMPGFRPEDDAFSVEPGHARRVRMMRCAASSEIGPCALTAVNLAGRVVLSAEASAR